MKQYELTEVLDGNYSNWSLCFEMWPCIQALNIKPYKDGNQWCFLYGENIQDGICGFGKTIRDAALDFYCNICNEEIVANKLKHLRPSWKPSEEQMNALNALNCHGDLSYVGQQNQLISLQKDLEKLKGGVAPVRDIDE